MGMGFMHLEIPVNGAGVGEVVRIDILLDTQGDTAPEHTSLRWSLAGSVPAGDLPATLKTGPIAEGGWVWYRGSEWTDGVRVSNYSTPVAIEVPLRPGFLASALNLAGTDPQGPWRLSWTPNSLAEGVRVEWSVDEIGATPTLANSTDVEASDGSIELEDLVPKGRALHVRLTAYDGFDAGSVDGDPGPTTTLTHPRPYTTSSPAPGTDPAADFARRIYVSRDLDLYHYLDGSLVISRPGAD